MTYSEIVREDQRSIISRTNSDGSISWIPKCTDNSDYQEYLAWVAEGNVATRVENTVTWDTIREKRSQLIRESDWTMIPGATVDQAQWAAYRQILRDLPQTYSNPEDVVWPTAPSTSGPNTIEE